MQEALFFNNKNYISAKRAGELTGYTSDYIGQLCRAGKISSQLIGKTRYVCREEILTYKKNFEGAGKISSTRDTKKVFSSYISRKRDVRKKILNTSSPESEKTETDDIKIDSPESKPELFDKSVGSDTLARKPQVKSWLPEIDKSIKYIKDKSALFPNLNKSFDSRRLKYSALSAIERASYIGRKKKSALDRWVAGVSVVVAALFLVGSASALPVGHNRLARFFDDVREEATIAIAPTHLGLDNFGIGGEMMVASIFVPSSLEFLPTHFYKYVNDAIYKVARPWIDDLPVITVVQNRIESRKDNPQKVQDVVTTQARTVISSGVSKNYVDARYEELKDYLDTRFLGISSVPTVVRQYVTRQSDSIVNALSAPITELNGVTINNSIFQGGTASFSSLVVSGTTTLTNLVSEHLSVGSTTPGYELTVVGSGYFDGGTVTASTLVATSSASLGSLTITGDGSGITFTGSGNHDITASSGTLRLGANVVIGNIEAMDDSIDIGTPGVRFDKIYANEVNASTIVGTFTSGNTTAETLSINSDNATADTEDSYLSFERGSTIPNALLRWNSTTKRFEFNMGGYFSNAENNAASTTLEVRAHSAQATSTFLVSNSSGSPMFNVNYNGNVGIGTTSPLGPLQVTSYSSLGIDGRDYSILIKPSIIGRAARVAFNGVDDNGIKTKASLIGESTNGQGDFAVYTTSAANFEEGTGTMTQRFLVTNTGLAGIGTTTPWARLSADTTSLSSGVPSFVVGSSTRTDLVVTQAGNVGIGTTNPTSWLSVYPGSTGNAVIGRTSLGGWSGGVLWGSIGYQTLNGNSDYAMAYSSSGQTLVNAASGQSINLRIANADKAVLSSSGNFGIGTTTPWATLAVNPTAGGASNQFVIGSSTATNFIVNNSGNVGIGSTSPLSQLSVHATTWTDTNNSQVSIFGVDNEAEVAAMKIIDENSNEYFRVSSTGASGSDKGKVFVFGNLGVGTTTPYAKLSVRADGSNAGHAFAVTDIAHNEKFTILDSGRVGIGESTPTVSLQVSGYNRALPATSGTTQTGVGLRITDSSGAGVLDMGTISGGGSWIQSTDKTSLAINYSLLLNPNGGIVGVGTTTPAIRGLTVASSTILTDGTGVAQWVTRNAGGNLYFATTTVAGTATTSTSALSIIGSSGNVLLASGGGNVGIGVSPSTKLDVSGTASSTGLQVNGYSRFIATTFNSAPTADFRLDFNGIMSDGTWGNAYPQFEVSNRNTTVGNTEYISFSGHSVGGFPGAVMGAVNENHPTGTNPGYGDLFFWTRSATSNGVRMWIDQSGNVGIGGTSPAAKFHVSADGNSVNSALVSSGNDQMILSQQDAAPGFSLIAASGSSATHRGVFKAVRSRGTLASPTIVQDGDSVFSLLGEAYDGSARRGMAEILFSVDGTPGSSDMPGRISFLTTPDGSVTRAEVLTIKNSGNIGIGTTTPSNKLTITDTAASQLTLSAGAGINQWAFRNAGGNLYFATTTVAGTATTSTSALSIIGSSGNVGIGTTTPTAQLSLYSASGGANYTQIGTLGASSLAAIGFAPTLTTSNYSLAGDGARTLVNAPSTAISFRVANGNDLMYINSSGNVGIGTSTPSNKLTISDSTASQLSLSAGAGIAQWVTRNAGGNLYFATTTVDGTATTSTSALTVVGSSGNVGIGTSDPTAKLQIVGTPGASGTQYISLQGSNGADWGIGLGDEAVNNLYIGGSAVKTEWYWRGNWITANTAHNTFQNPAGDTGLTVMEIIRHNSGDTGDYLHITSNGGTSGDLLNLNASGNVGIGTTTPWATLAVNPTAGNASNQFVVGSSTATNFVVTNSGSVGIGTTTPGALLGLYRSGTATMFMKYDDGAGNFMQFVGGGYNDINAYGAALRFYSASNGIQFRTGGADPAVTLSNAGNLGIGTTTPWKALSVNGGVAMPALSNDSTGYYVCLNTTTGNLATSTTACGASSERFKENIQDLEYGLDEILQLEAVTFDYKSDYIPNAPHQVGFIAERVDPIMPELVAKNSEGQIQGLDYPKFVAVLVKGVQELNAKVDTLLSQVGQALSWFRDNKLFVQGDVCVDDTCITKDQFKEMILRSGVGAVQVVTGGNGDSGAASTTGTATSTGSGQATSTATTTPATTDTGTSTSTPVTTESANATTTATSTPQE